MILNKISPFIILFLFSLNLYAQGKKEFIMLSGVIVDGKDAEAVPAVHLYIPDAGRGTISNLSGYFALPTMAGDSLVISSVGYKKQYVIIPERPSGTFSVVIELKEDTTLLPIVEVFPFPTEELFKEAFLTLELPYGQRTDLLRQDLNSDFMRRNAFTAPMDAKMNYRYTIQQQQYYQGANRYAPPPITLLNPFAWAELFRSVKRGDFKRGKWKDRD